MGIYTPDRPYVLGQQWAPLVADQVRLDTGSEIGYTFRARATTTTIQRSRLLSTVPPPGTPTRKELLVNLYHGDQIVGTGPIRKVILPCTSGSLGTGATLQGGAATVQAAVDNPSGAGYVKLLGASAYVRHWFDFSSRYTAVLQYRRILDVSVLYSISGPFTDLANAVSIGIERPSATLNWVMDQTVTGPATLAEGVQLNRSRLGELNPFWSTAVTPSTSTDRLAWNLTAGAGFTSGLQAMEVTGGTNTNIRFTTSSAATASQEFHLNYVALEVTYCEENRLGSGGLDISSGATAYITDIWTYNIKLLGVGQNYGGNVGLTEGELYAVTVGQAYSGQESVNNTVPVMVDRLGAVDVFPTHDGIVIGKTIRAGELQTLTATRLMPSITMYHNDNVDTPSTVDLSSHSYLAQIVASPSSRWGATAQAQQIADDAAGSFVWVRFYARHLPDTDSPLTVQQVDQATGALIGPTATITVPEFDELDEIVDGWAEVTLRLSTAAVLTNAGTVTKWTFTSSTDSGSPWQILGGDANPTYEDPLSVNETGYEGLSTTAVATWDGLADGSADLTVMIVQEMDTVAGLAISQQTQELTVVDPDCGVGQRAIPTGILYHHLSWTAVNSPVVAGWGYYEIQRRDTTMDTDVWETIAEITTPAVTTMDDYEARVGVQSSYRIRMVHRLGIAGPWSSTVTNTPPAPGVTGTGADVGLLILTTNHNPAANLAYAFTTSRNDAEDFAYPEAGDVDLQTMYGRDYQVAFRPLERGGVTFTRTLLVNAAGVPTTTLDKAFTGLRDLAWDTVPYVCVRDELANRWLSTLIVPSSTVQRVPAAGHLELAQLSVTEVTATPAPVDTDPPCEGLTQAVDDSAAGKATTPIPTALLAPSVGADTWTRSTSNGWGTADTGGAWTIEAGTVSHFSSTGTRGRQQHTVVNETHWIALNPGVTDVDVTVDLVITQASAATAPIAWDVVVRETDTANNYRVVLQLTTGGVLTIGLAKTVANVFGSLQAQTNLTGHTAGAVWRIRGQIRGSRFRAKAWIPASQTEPGWTRSVVVPNDGIGAGTKIALRSRFEAGNTNTLPANVEWDNLTVRNPASDLDLRLLVRPNGDGFDTALSALVLSGSSGGWDLDVSTAGGSYDVYGENFADGTVTATQLSVYNNERRWYRVTYDLDNGAGQASAQFYTSLDGSSWSTAGSAILDTMEPPTFDTGTITLSTTLATLIKAEIRSGIAGTLVASPDFEAEDAGTTSFADAQGNTWTVTQGGVCGG